MSKNADKNTDKAVSTDAPVLNDLSGPTADQVAGTDTVASADTPTTANQDAAVNAAVSDQKDVLQPGDDGYDANSDPVIPSSALAEVVAAELAGSDGSSP